MDGYIEQLCLVLLAGIVAVLCSGCGIVSMPSPMDDGHITIAGDAKGMHAFGDVMNGMIAEGKASPNIKAAYFQTREMQEVERTRRALSPGLLGGLFAPKNGGAK